MFANVGPLSSTLTVGIDTFTLGVTENGLAPAASDLWKQATTQDIGKLSLVLQADARGGLVRKQNDLTKVPEATRDIVKELGEQVQHSLDLVSFAMPSGEAKPGQTWQARRPIPMKAGELTRIYLINVTEFDPINSMHLYATFFDYYDHGTTLTPTQRVVDTIMQCQAQRGILGFVHRWPGKYMVHAHQAEFTELGWMGMFNVATEEGFPAALAEAGLDEEWDHKAVQGSTVVSKHVPLTLKRKLR